MKKDIVYFKKNLSSDYFRVTYKNRFLGFYMSVSDFLEDNNGFSPLDCEVL